jgi:DNA-binding response OmpR family regulator
MLIEDDKTMLSLLSTLLEMEGFQVSMAGDENMDCIMDGLIEEKPDLALVDVHLRKSNGFDLLGKINQHDNLKNTRILMSSGMNFEEECLQAGADGFILKPYMPDELISTIRKLLDNHE